MKILFISPYITVEGIHGFEKIKTGFGYMVSDIARALSMKGSELDIITASALTGPLSCKGFNILRRKISDILFCFKPSYIFFAVKMLRKYKVSFKRRLQILFYYSSMGYIEKLLKKNRYDIVHIHGIDMTIFGYISLMEKTGVPYIVTSHGLNSFSKDVVKMQNGEKQAERDYLITAKEKNIPTTFISSGMLRTVSDFLGGRIPESFRVIPNACEIPAEKIVPAFDLRKKYNIPKGNKILLSVGNIHHVKNQVQSARAYMLLPQEIKDSLYVLYVGNPEQIDEIEALENSHLIICGKADREIIYTYYSQSDFTVVSSLKEGFGLSVIEGFACGLPSVMFRDLDAAKDLYDEKAIILADRSDEALSRAIAEAVGREWDREYIKGYAKRFSLEKMADNYIEFYEDCINYD